ncbi:MAG: RNA polymerase sigma factor [Polyangiaceae bacterium]|nr:RNA polymerase sigma factor [Polyangiaceae bacterium]
MVLPVGTTPERALLDGLVAQQPNAVAALYDRYVGLVQRVLVRTLGNDRDLDDLTQDVLITVVRRCPTLRDPDALRSFIVSVVLRIARNELRKRAIRRLVGLEEASGLGACMPHDAAAAQGIRHLYGALDRLDANSRAAFVLRHVEGCNLAETAAGCGCSLATVKRWLARAEKRFAALARSDHVLRELLDSTKEKP